MSWNAKLDDEQFHLLIDLSFLTLLHSERPKLHGVLTILSAIGLNEEIYGGQSLQTHFHLPCTSLVFVHPEHMHQITIFLLNLIQQKNTYFAEAILSSACLQSGPDIKVLRFNFSFDKLYNFNH